MIDTKNLPGMKEIDNSYPRAIVRCSKCEGDLSYKTYRYHPMCLDIAEIDPCEMCTNKEDE